MNQICSSGVPPSPRLQVAGTGPLGGILVLPQRHSELTGCPRLSSGCLNKRQNGGEAEGGGEVKE